MKIFKLIWILAGAMFTAIGMVMVYGREGAREILDIISKEYDAQLKCLRAKLGKK